METPAGLQVQTDRIVVLKVGDIMGWGAHTTCREDRKTTVSISYVFRLSYSPSLYFFVNHRKTTRHDTRESQPEHSTQLTEQTNSRPDMPWDKSFIACMSLLSGAGRLTRT